MGVAGASQGGALDWGGLGARVPEQDLAAVGPANDQVGVEGGELGGEDIGLRVEDVFGAVVKM